MRTTITLAAIAAAAVFSATAIAAPTATYSCSLSATGQVLIVEATTVAPIQQLCPALAAKFHLHLRWSLHVVGGTTPVATWLYRPGGLKIILQAEQLSALKQLIRAYSGFMSPASWKRVAPELP
jgi:hypothetical protein